jgi:hypothetical protein
MSQSGIYKNRLNFSIIDDGNPQTIVVLDSSEYADDVPEKPKVDILLPGSNEATSLAYIPNEVNVYNSSTLGATCETGSLANLSDGLYWITLRVCPYDKAYKTKAYLRTLQLEYSFQNVLLALAVAPCSQKDDALIKIKKIEFYLNLETAKAHTEIGNGTQAMDYYRLAEKVITNLTTNYL